MTSRASLRAALAMVALAIITSFTGVLASAESNSLPCEFYGVISSRTYDPAANITTFSWTVSVCPGTGVKDISHSVVVTCVTQADVLSAGPGPVEYGLDPSTGFFGIKFNSSIEVVPGCGSQTYTATFPGDWPGTQGSVVIKAGTGICTISAVVPSCVTDPCSCSNNTDLPVWAQPMPGEMNVECGTPLDFSSIAATVPCSRTVTVVISFTVTATGPCPIVEVRRYTATATDSCGRSIQHEWSVNIRDTTPPAFTCPPAATVGSVEGMDPDITGWPVGDDSCSSVSFSYNDATVSQTGCRTVFNRVWTGTDGCGNQATCMQTIVLDECQPQETSIKAVKFYDYNENGLMDGDDYPEEGISVNVYTAAGCSGVAVVTGITGTDGSVSFLLDPGTYWVNVIPPAGQYVTNGNCREVAVVEGTQTTVYFGNHEEDGGCPDGSWLVIRKEWGSGTELPEVDDLEFLVDGGVGQLFMPVEGGDANALQIPVNPGTYTIQEVIDALDGYSVSSESSKGDQGSSSITVIVGACETVEVTFTNSICDDDDGSGCSCGGANTGCGGHLYQVLMSTNIPRICLGAPVYVTAPNYMTGYGRVVRYHWYFPQHPWSTQEKPAYALPNGSFVYRTLETMDDGRTASFIPDVPSRDGSSFEKNYVLVCEAWFSNGTIMTLGYEFYAEDRECDPFEDVIPGPESYTIVVFPNPSDDFFTFEVRDQFLMAVEVDSFFVEIYDLAGRVIWSDTGRENPVRWDTLSSNGEYMANGCYIYVAVAVVDSTIIKSKSKVSILR